MKEPARINSPLDTNTVKSLRAGDSVLISGTVYVARDAAHKRFVQALDEGQALPFDLKGQTIYYMGPSPAKPGQVIGSAGPTTSSRMDVFTPRLLNAGMRAMIGKGKRSEEVREAIVKYRAVYFVVVGGVGALLAKSIKKAELIAYPDLGAEAVLKLTVVDFPAIVANDIYGNDVYLQGGARFWRED